MKKKDFFPQIVSLSLVILTFFLPSASSSKDFPEKPIELYVGYAPGAATDITARAIAKDLEKSLGEAIVVINKPGGSSSVAASLLASKKADGYTLAVISAGALLGSHIMAQNVTYDPMKDFTFIVAYARYNAGAVCVQAESPFKTLPEFIDHARKNPGVLSYSHTGTGNPFHLAMGYMAKQAKVQFKAVPFPGGTPAMTALLGGHVDFIAGSGSHLKYVRQGVWRMLAILMGTERDPNFPDVPTLTEFGYGCPAAPSALMVVAPKNLPEPIFKKIEGAFQEAVKSPEFRNILNSLDMPFVYMNRQQMEEEIKSNYAFFEGFIKELGLKK